MQSKCSPARPLWPLLLAWLLLFPAPGRARDATLAGLTDATFSKWLTGTEWKGESGGRRGHLWFATPGIIIWRWEVNPGVWDCRACALIPETKGKVKWRWNDDAVVPCTVKLAEDLQSSTLEDSLLGKWTIKLSGRKSASVSGGKLATQGAAGFAAWLEKQAIHWRGPALIFGKKRSAAWEGGGVLRCEIPSPGVVEVYPGNDPTECMLVIFTPGLASAMVYGTWGVFGARVKGAPPTTIVPSPVFNDPDPALKTLSEMKKEDFESWLVGTEWEHFDGVTTWYWYPVPGMITCRGVKDHFAFGASVLETGAVRWQWRAEPEPVRAIDFKMQASLSDGEYVWEGGKRHAATRLVARRMPFPMHAPPANRMSEILKETKVVQGNDGHFLFPSATMARWFGKSDGRVDELNLNLPGPGMAMWSYPSHPDNCGLIVYRQPAGGRLYNKWGAMDVTFERGSPGSPGSGIFDMGLTGTKAIPVRKPVTSVNALVVMDLGDDRTAGALSKLSLTSLAVTNEEAATLTFNQPVGESMKKALREVSRFHAIRQSGWPRGQKMELSFADKYSPKDGPSAAVACALLLESALRGVMLQPGFAVTGDMNADGSVQPIGGVAAKLRGATKGGCTCVAIPDKNSVQATDLALTDGAAPFLGIQVFSIATFDEAAKLAVRDDALLKAVMDSFALIAKKVKADSAALRHPDTVQALRELSRQAPTHLSARLLLAIAEGKLPASLSPGGSVTAINLAITDALESTGRELLAKSNLDRGKVAAARSRLQQLRTKLDRRTLPLADGWIGWCQFAERITAAAAGGGKVDGKLIEEIKAAAARIQAEEEKLGRDAEFNEDLMR